MVLKLYDYRGKFIEHDVGDKDDIIKIVIKIVTGDELAVITFRNGDSITYDSSDNRIIDYFDGHYTIYDEQNNIDELADWDARSTYTYDYLRSSQHAYFYEEE